MKLRRTLLLTAVLLGGSVLSGCAGVLRSYDIAPGGLHRDDERLRRMLADGRAADAWTRVQEDAPEDEMLQSLYAGIVAYHAGEYARSAHILDNASLLAEDRATKSVSRSALSLISNDRVLPYEPSTTERLLIPYYAAQARLRSGDLEGAAVEARRLSLLLQFDDEKLQEHPSDLIASLRYFAGAVLEAAGDREHGDVAYRNAFALDSLLPAASTYAPDSGDVVVILEQGFVGHRVEQALSVMLLPVEVRALHRDGDERALAAGLIAERVLSFAAGSSAYDAATPQRTLHVPAPHYSPLAEREARARSACGDTATSRGKSRDRENGGRRRNTSSCDDDDDDTLPYLLRVAWPVFRADARPPRAALVAGGDTVMFHTSASISEGVRRDFEAERPLLVARTLARGAAKLAITKGAERRIEEKNPGAARLVGLLANAGNVLLERADTRSWHLLPASISVVRLRMPAGTQSLAIRTSLQEVAATRDVTVHAGGVTVVPVRLW